MNKVFKVSQDLLVHQDFQDPKVNVACLDRRVHKETQVLLVHLEKEDLRVWLACLVLREHVVPLEREENLALWDLLAALATLAHL